MKKISTLVGIVIIVAVAVVIFGGVFAYQYFAIKTNSGAKDSQTAGWQTYTSNELKYSFKYPSGWKVIPNYAYSAAGAGGLVGYTITTSNSKTPPDNERIDIGGAQVDCASLSNLNRQEHPAGVLCKTNYPVYTFSTDPSVISVFNVIVGSISDIKPTTPVGITADQQLKINNLDYSFVFTSDSIKIYDAKNSFLQELKIGKDEMEMAKFDLKNYGHQTITANDDVNFDGYKDLAVEIGNGYGGVNFFYNFYYFNPTTKKFVEVPELKSVCNPNIKYEQKQILSSCKSGPGYSDSIYQFGAAGYIITTIPKIYRIDPENASAGNQISIYGNNFSGFEGDLNVWIENSSGVKGIIYGDKKFSDDAQITFTLPVSVCQQDNSYSGLPCSATLQLTPGNYKIFVRPWSTESNKVDFTIK
jgi:hypothetical protein